MSNIRFSGFYTFLEKWKGKGAIAALVLLGIILILLPRGTEAEASSEADDEQRFEQICSMTDGVGECQVMISRERSSRNSEERVVGVVVLCEGAHSAEVRAAVTDIATALFGIGSNRVCILPLSK